MIKRIVSDFFAPIKWICFMAVVVVVGPIGFVIGRLKQRGILK